MFYQEDVLSCCKTKPKPKEEPKEKPKEEPIEVIEIIEIVEEETLNKMKVDIPTPYK